MVCINRTLGSIDVSVNESRTDLDSHADQCAVGRNVLVVHDFDRPINVTGYNPNGAIAHDLQTVTAAMAYDDALTGQTVILLVHQQAILVPYLDHNLLSTMQRCIMNDVTVKDIPCFLTNYPTLPTQSFLIPRDNPNDTYVIPMLLHSVNLHRNTYKAL